MNQRFRGGETRMTGNKIDVLRKIGQDIKDSLLEQGKGR
jgi:hypothetical protein